MHSLSLGLLSLTVLDFLNPSLAPLLIYPRPAVCQCRKSSELNNDRSADQPASQSGEGESGFQ